MSGSCKWLLDLLGYSLHLYLCTSVCVWTLVARVFAHVLVCVSMVECVSLYVCTRVCVCVGWVGVLICACVCICVCVCARACMYVLVHAHISVC